MKKWLAHVQVNSEDVSRFETCDIEISEEQYETMVKAVEDKIPIKELNFYNDIIEKAESCIDFMNYVNKEEPQRSDYDDEDEEYYLEALVE